MRKNTVKAKVKRGEPSVGTWVSSGSPLITEALAHTDFDWLTIDLEHNAIDLQDCVNCLYAMSYTDKVPFVRVPWNDPQIIKRVLDIGALGVVIPDVKNPEEAEQAVKASRYAPDGFRGIGSTRGQLYYGADYYQKANEEVCVVLMIEDVEAVEKIDDIMQVPGVDVCFIGPNDLASSLGVPLGLDNPHPDHKAAVRKVLEAGKRHGVPVGIHCASPQELARRIDEGFTWLPIGSDIRLLRLIADQTFRYLEDRRGDVGAGEEVSRNIY